MYCIFCETKYVLNRQTSILHGIFSALLFFFVVWPTIITRPINKTVTEGAITTLLCEATGNPTPKITWIKDGKTVGEGETLSIEANRTDSGKYLCSAENGLKSIVNASANLDVQCEYCLHCCTFFNLHFDWPAFPSCLFS